MDMFNAKDRRNPKMDDYMDVSKPAFGGPKEIQDFDKSKRTFLKGYQREIERNADFEGGKENPNYDTTWKAISRDVVNRQAGKKPFDPMYTTPTFKTSDKIEEGRILRYNEFVNENFEDMLNGEENEEMPNGMEGMEDMPEKPELDEEKLEALIEEFGTDMKTLIDAVCEAMELEKEECCDYICAAIEKVCHSPEEEEEGEEKEEDAEEEENEEK
jgi:hypothetical protein